MFADRLGRAECADNRLRIDVLASGTLFSIGVVLGGAWMFLFSLPSGLQFGLAAFSAAFASERIARFLLDRGLLHLSARNGTNPHCPAEKPSSLAASGGHAGHRGNKSCQQLSLVPPRKHSDKLSVRP